MFNFLTSYSSAAAFRTISPNSSSSSDSFDDSFKQICKPAKKPSGSSISSDTASLPTEEDSMFQSFSQSDSTSVKNKIGEEECDELDEMFKNFDLKDSRDVVPIDWLENDELPLPNTAAALSTVYEGSESKYHSSKSVNASTISKGSCHLELSQDSLINFIKPSETSTDSLERSFVTSNNILPIELNDTLEDVEYICDKNRYLLKPVSKPSKISTSSSVAWSSADSSVVVVDSSPETSFATAQNDMKVIDVKDIKTETLSDKSSVSYDTLTSLASTNDISLAPTVSSTNLSFTTARNDLELIDTDDIKSEFSCDKTSTNSWTTLDLSEAASTAPIIDNRNDSLFIAKNKLKSSDCNDMKSEVSSDDGPMFTCISYPKTSSFFELDHDKSVNSDIGKSSEYYTAVATNDSTSSTSRPSASAARFVIIFPKNVCLH